MKMLHWTLARFRRLTKGPGSNCDICAKGKVGINFAEAVVLDGNNLKENSMQVVNVGRGKVLLIKQKGKLHALGAKCPHYGAPLDKGVLGNGRIRCPWHGACFNIETGDIEDFPGLDCLPRYNVFEKNGKVIVRADEYYLREQKRTKPMFTHIKKNPTVFIVVGGGAAGNMCVQTLREEGYTGRIVFILGEPYLPYERVKLSKLLFIDPESVILRCRHFYEELGVELKIGNQMESLNSVGSRIRLTDGETLSYGKLFLATGARGLILNNPGNHLQNIFTLRNIDDAQAIGKAVTPEMNVAVIGSSFIAMESATFLSPLVKSITIVSTHIPFKNLFGEEVGERIKLLCEEKGINMICNGTVKKFLGGDNKLESILLTDGQEIIADICIIGMGVKANSEYFPKDLGTDGSIVVDEYLRTIIKDVYAGGDVANAPVFGTSASIKHWQLANYHGRIGALNMLGRQEKLKSVPFFWTVLFGNVFRYCGYAPKFSSVKIRGDLKDLKFIAFYLLESDEVGAVLTTGMDPLAAQFAEFLSADTKIKLNAADIDTWLRKVSAK